MSRVGRPSPVRAVLFDVDDTLYDHSYASRQAMLEVRRRAPDLATVPLEEMVRRGEEILREVHLDLVLTGRTSAEEARTLRMSRLAEALGRPMGPERARELAKHRQEAYLRHERAVPGSVELLRELRSRGLHLGIVSNNRVAEQARKIRAVGLEPFLQSRTLAEEAGILKPDPSIFHLAVKRTGITREACVMVGDSWQDDVIGARAAGVDVVWFNRSGAPPGPEPSVRELASFVPTERALQIILEGPERAARPAPARATHRPMTRVAGNRNPEPKSGR